MRAQQTDAEDAQITLLIQAAREEIEDLTGRSGNPTQYQYTIDRFPLLPNSQYTPGNPSLLTPVLQNTWPLSPSSWAIWLPRSPLISVDSFNYLDVNGDLQTVPTENYVVDNQSEPPRIVPANQSYWPATTFSPDTVQIIFTAGYQADSGPPMPARYQTAIMMLAAHWYEHREAAGEMRVSEVPLAFDSIVAKLATSWFLPVG